MKKSHKKKIIITSALAAAAVVGGAATLIHGKNVSAVDDASTTDTSSHKVEPELSEEKKAEIKAKLDNMTEEEKQAWLESHKKGDHKESSEGVNQNE